MSTLNFKTHIKNIREEMIKTGFSPTTIYGYEKIWKNYLKWLNTDNTIYDGKEYSKFLLEYYGFDVNTYTNKSKSFYQQLMRSKRLLDNFGSYKGFMEKRMFPKSLYSNYPNNWNIILNSYLDYCKDVRQNSEKTIIIKKRYLEKELSYFYNKGIKRLNDFSIETLNIYINDTIKAGVISKRRNFYVLRDFLNYLFIEDILKIDLSVYVPKVKNPRKKRLPTFLKQDSIEELLKSIKKNTKHEIRDYAIITIAARLGLRISDILNIKLKDIDWENKKITVLQPKTNNLNTLPLLNDVGWAIIDYIKNARPICDNEYLFVKMKYPFEKLNTLQSFNKYFEKLDIEISKENKKGIHNLRSSLAKNMLDNDIPINIISSTLGHKNSDTTINFYTSIDIKKLKKCCLEVEK